MKKSIKTKDLHYILLKRNTLCSVKITTIIVVTC